MEIFSHLKSLLILLIGIKKILGKFINSVTRNGKFYQCESCLILFNSVKRIEKNMSENLLQGIGIFLSGKVCEFFNRSGKFSQCFESW